MLYQVPYTKIGLGFISVLSIIMFSLFWLHKSNYDQCKILYDIHFHKTVSGLRKGDVVVYNGVSAGRVKDIFIRPNDVENVVVRVCLLPGFPIKTDAFAVVETKSIAGGTIIAITGGSNATSVLKPQKKGHIPVICARQSRVDQVIDAAPQIMGQIHEVLTDVGALFSGPEKKKWKEIIHLVNTNLTKFDKIQGHVVYLLDSNKGNLKDLLGPGAKGMQKFFQNGAEAMTAVKKLAEQIERSPARFLAQDPGKGTVLR